MAEAYRLEHAPDPVAQMHAHKNHCDDIEDRNRDDPEAIDEIVVSIERNELRMNRTGSQVKKMKNDEDKNDQAAPHHRARGQTCLHIAAFDVSNWARFPLEQREFDRRPDVKNAGHHEYDPDNPQQ